MNLALREQIEPCTLSIHRSLFARGRFDPACSFSKYHSLGKPAVSVSRNIGDIVMEQTSENVLLNWDVFVTPGIPIVTRDLPPGVREAYFQAMASTLIYGMRDAVLVDAFMTVKQANALADWIAAKDKNLTTIYITHGHGDHWFGTATLLERFPNARAVATPSTVQVMRGNASPEALD